MPSSGGGSGSDERIPRLAPGWEDRGGTLSPGEGFLLSRIDGRTPWTLLRQIGGLPPEEADRTLEAWLEAGLVVVETGTGEGRSGSEMAPSGSRARSAAPAAGASVDPSLDLDPELQRRILAFEERLDRASYHEILGIGRGADAREIKRAYFRLSKTFHPDRYFRRKIGDFGSRLERIFKRVVEAYELLSDPTTRTEIERSMPPEEAEAGAYREGPAGRTESLGAASRPGGYRTPSRLENLERLRRSFRMPKKVLMERQFKARQLFQTAQVAVHRKSWIEAAASARLAIAFDPWNRSYKEAFSEIQAEVHQLRAAELLERAEGAGADEVLRLLEEALHYRPSDPALAARTARLALEANEVERALEYAESACLLAPEEAESHVLLSRALRRNGREAEAGEALARAASLAPKHPEVLSEQRLLRRGGSRAGGGKR